MSSPAVVRDDEPVLGRDDVVTGEAVALDLPVASIGLRILGFLVDAVVLVAVLVVAGAVASLIGYSTDAALGNAFVTALVVVLMLVLPAVVEITSHGRSLGKLAVGTRVVRVDHGPLSARHSLVRATLGMVELWFSGGAVAACFALFTPRCQRAGDLAAGTLVVKERQPLVLPPPVPMPPHLAAWAVAADLGQVPPRLAMSIRTFLLRRGTLTPQARAVIGLDLAAQAERCVRPPAPPAHPEDVLAAVVAERARRDLIAQRESAARWQRLTGLASGRR